jgi:hypothetical protein
MIRVEISLPLSIDASTINSSGDNGVESKQRMFVRDRSSVMRGIHSMRLWPCHGVGRLTRHGPAAQSRAVGGRRISHVAAKHAVKLRDGVESGPVRHVGDAQLRIAK